jgi:uncharacterized membrane protein YtjA (UPF0391 family)
MPGGCRSHVGTVLQQPGAPAYNCDAGVYIKVATQFPLKLERLREIKEMLHYAVVFFIIAIIAAVLGFGGIAAGAAGIAKVLFFVFLVLALITFLRRA